MFLAIHVAKDCMRVAMVNSLHVYGRLSVN